MKRGRGGKKVRTIKYKLLKGSWRGWKYLWRTRDEDYYHQEPAHAIPTHIGGSLTAILFVWVSFGSSSHTGQLLPLQLGTIRLPSGNCPPRKNIGCSTSNLLSWPPAQCQASSALWEPPTDRLHNKPVPRCKSMSHRYIPNPFSNPMFSMENNMNWVICQSYRGRN